MDKSQDFSFLLAFVNLKEMKIISKTVEETSCLAIKFLLSLESRRSEVDPNKSRGIILLLEGDLGSGKTTFTQALACELGIKNQVTSPTFVLMKSYKISTSAIEKFGLSVKNLVHFDAYRLNSGVDLLSLGWTELVANPDNLIVLEWPEKVADLFTGVENKINFKFIDEETREIEPNF